MLTEHILPKLEDDAPSTNKGVIVQS